MDVNRWWAMCLSGVSPPRMRPQRLSSHRSAEPVSGDVDYRGCRAGISANCQSTAETTGVGFARLSFLSNSCPVECKLRTDEHFYRERWGSTGTTKHPLAQTRAFCHLVRCLHDRINLPREKGHLKFTPSRHFLVENLSTRKNSPRLAQDRRRRRKEGGTTPASSCCGASQS